MEPVLFDSSIYITALRMGDEAAPSFGFTGVAKLGRAGGTLRRGRH
jgi:hypothetical protein